ncbi:hypothetical protein LPJ59_004281 [Coemansia sp. RSA 2399]|nr:hypothetical protein LPJ59_004281 [Coemansia sp. RSA 2399]
MLRVLNKNIEACRVEPKYKKKRNESEQVVYATEYLWGGLPEDMQIVSEPVDLVVASDCVYHEGVVALLVQTLGALCRSRADGAPTVVVVGQELRSDLVHQAFVEGLLSTFVVHRMPVSESVDGAFALYVAWLKGVDLLS